MSQYFTFDVDSSCAPSTYQLLSPTSQRASTGNNTTRQQTANHVHNASTPNSVTAPLPATQLTNGGVQLNTSTMPLHTTTNADTVRHSHTISISQTAESTINLINITDHNDTAHSTAYIDLLASTQTSPQLSSIPVGSTALFESLPSSAYDNTIIQLSPIASPAISRNGSSIYQPHAVNAASTLFSNSSRALSNTYRHPLSTSHNDAHSSTSNIIQHNTPAPAPLHPRTNEQDSTQPPIKRQRHDTAPAPAVSNDTNKISISSSSSHTHNDQDNDSSDTCTECQRDYPTCIICQDVLVQARQYSCHRHMACLRCINGDINCKLQPSFSPFSFNVDQKQFILQGTTHCPVCRSSDTAVTAELTTVFELPKEAQSVMFKSGKLYTCAFCDIPADTYTSISAHGSKCTNRKLTCPECKQSFSAVNGFTTHVLNDCTSVPCPHYSCGQKGTYAFAKSHSQYHDNHNKLRTGLDRIARAAGSFDLSTVDAVSEANQRISAILSQLNVLNANTPRLLQPSRSDVTPHSIAADHTVDSEPLFEFGESASTYMMSPPQSPLIHADLLPPRRAASLHGLLQRQQAYRQRANRAIGPHEPQLLAPNLTRRTATSNHDNTNDDNNHTHMTDTNTNTNTSSMTDLNPLSSWQSLMLSQLRRVQADSLEGSSSTYHLQQTDQEFAHLLQQPTITYI